eukprot:1186284-Prorocentrum_minimum.AAC.2
MASIDRSSCANNGKDTVNTPDCILPLYTCDCDVTTETATRKTTSCYKAQYDEYNETNIYTARTTSLVVQTKLSTEGNSVPKKIEAVPQPRYFSNTVTATSSSVFLPWCQHAAATSYPIRSQPVATRKSASQPPQPHIGVSRALRAAARSAPSGRQPDKADPARATCCAREKEELSSAPPRATIRRL